MMMREKLKFKELHLISGIFEDGRRGIRCRKDETCEHLKWWPNVR